MSNPIFFQPLRSFHSAVLSALILFIYLWLFYQSANTPLRDASIAALLPAAASSFTMVSLYALSVTVLLSLLNRVFRDAKVAGWFARLISAPLLFITALLIIENWC
ncbi:hypothetical protein OAS73_02940, partial [Luminiphilus sp.]|nr:hypothetical protein [Luminiphilus sp.]